MSNDDESELLRLATLLRRVDERLPKDAPEREALVKAGLALAQELIRGNRPALEAWFSDLSEPLSEQQVVHLIRLGVDPSPRS